MRPTCLICTFAIFCQLILPVTNAQARLQEAQLAKCAIIKDSLERLSCFDELMKQLELDQPSAEHSTSGKWHVSTERSKIDDSLTVVISLAADNSIRGWLETHWPSLVLRCKENKTQAYIVTGMPPNTELGVYDGATAVIRFDDRKAAHVKMNKSTDNKALFFEEWRSIEFIERMERHKTLLFQFTPFNASPTMTTFQLVGLSEPLRRLRKACHW